MKLSIITINFNNCHGLIKTINSVIQQTYKDFEYIVIDGGSSDGSIDIIKQNSGKLSHWVSAPDKGIYNAMNNGIKASKGEYLLFLNSGDYLINGSILENISNELKNDPIIYGNGILETAESKYIKIDIPETLKLDYFSGASLFHPASFIKRSLFDTYGLYNEQNSIVSDWEFFIKTIMINDVKARKIPFEISVAEDNGMSRNKANRHILQKEIENVLKNYFPVSVIDLISDYKKLKNKDKFRKDNFVEKFILKLLGTRNKWKKKN